MEYTGIFALILTGFVIYMNYKISRRMGFSQGHSIIIAAIGLFGLSIFVWWVSKWPNEADVVAGAGVDE